MDEPPVVLLPEPLPDPEEPLALPAVAGCLLPDFSPVGDESDFLSVDGDDELSGLAPLALSDFLASARLSVR